MLPPPPRPVYNGLDPRGALPGVRNPRKTGRKRMEFKEEAGVQMSWWTILLLILAPQLAVLAQLGLSRAREDRAATAPASGLAAARMGTARAFMAAYPSARLAIM
jgi:hypothetical protein